MVEVKKNAHIYILCPSSHLKGIKMVTARLATTESYPANFAPIRSYLAYCQRCFVWHISELDA